MGGGSEDFKKVSVARMSSYLFSGLERESSQALTLERKSRETAN